MDDWVFDELITRLEPRYRLFVPSRDLGTGIELEMLDANAKKSRRTMIVLSRAMSSRAVAKMYFLFETALNLIQNTRLGHRLVVVLWEDDLSLEKGALLYPDFDVVVGLHAVGVDTLRSSDMNFWLKVLNFMASVNV